MGKSAKLHKRLKKVKSGQSPNVASSASAVSQAHEKVHVAKKRASLKEKVKSDLPSKGGGKILGGADYVELMMGGRRKARREAQKLPST